MTRQHFDGLEFFAGATATIADIALFPSFALSRDFNIDHDAFPALRRWARAQLPRLRLVAVPAPRDFRVRVKFW